MAANYRRMQKREGVTKGEGAMAGLTRTEVAALLGVSVATVRRMEGKALHPKMVGGTWLFDPGQVATIRRSPSSTARRIPSDGELAAEIFRRFDQGQSLRQIVRECQQSPKVVQMLYQDWATPLGGRPNADVDERSQVVHDEQELLRWEQAMRAIITADENRDIEDRREREARRCPRQWKRPA